MSTQNKTQSTNQYDPTSQGTFNQLQSGIGSNLQDFMSNPLQSSFFNTQLQMAQRANGNRMQAQNQALAQNATTGGFTGNLPAFLQSQMQQNSRQLSANNSNSFNNLLLGANQLRFGATQSAMGYRPMQTGQTQTQTQGGLGSWLPQLAGAAIGGLTGMGAIGGAASSLGSSFFKGAGAGPQGMSSGGLWGGSMGAGPDPNPFMGQMPGGMGGYNPGSF